MLVTAFMLLTAAGAQAAGPWYVATNGNDATGAGTLANPYASISNALTNATASDTIWVSNGVYALDDQVDNYTKSCKIRAWSTNPADTVLLGLGSNDVSKTFRGVSMSGAGSLLQGFTVTNFYLTNSAYGAGVYCSAGLISNCVITGNIMGYNKVTGGDSGPRVYGCGVYLTGAGVIENCDIIGNWNYPNAYATGGGGIMMDGYDGGQMRNCRVVGNTFNSVGSTHGAGVWAYPRLGFVIRDSVIASNTGSTYGGGIDISGGTVSNCQVFANSASTGGGIYFYTQPGWYGSMKADVRIERCVISNNAGITVGACYVHDDGAGIITNVLIVQCAIVNNYCDPRANAGLYMGGGVSNIWIRNCLVANNRGGMSWGESGYRGCGIRVTSRNALIENCTIVSNRLGSSGSPQGAGLYATNGVRVVNTIIYHNSGVASSNIYAFADCAFSNSCTAPLSEVTGTANTDADPQFVAKGTGNFRLNNNSPCLNTGMNYEWMTGAVDLEGRKRIRYGTVDMGAYERIHSGTTYGFR